jgi:hypothetical protein
MVNVKMKKQTKVVAKDVCLGGYCSLEDPPKRKGQILTKGEGVSPPLKNNEVKEVYQLSYPDENKIKPIVVGHMYLLWMGHRWYSSP